MANQQTSRLTAGEIYERVEASAHEELIRPAHNLMFAAVSAGLAMGLSALGVSILLSLLGNDGAGQTIAYLAYPFGFLVVIIGRQQLFTENTLFPVALVLSERDRLWSTLRLWGVVLSGNAIGATLFALLATHTPSLDPAIRSELMGLGESMAGTSLATTFWTAVVAGWMIALVAWLVTACRDTAGQILIIFFVTFIVGAGHFAHSIAGMTEVISAVFGGGVSVGSGLLWAATAVVGNTVGGVVIVALFNYGQVHQRKDWEPEKQEEHEAASVG